MSYQRPTKGRYYIWMETEGLRVAHSSITMGTVRFDNGNADHRANAKQMIRGLVDFLAAEGLAVKISDTGVTFRKAPVPEYVEDVEA